MAVLKKICSKNRPVPVTPGKYGWLLALLLAGCLMPGWLYAGAQDSLQSLRFIKTDTRLPRPGSYFNVLEVRNLKSESLTGIVRINCPDGWRYIGAGSDTFRLAPGGTKLIPVRISIPGNALGGISYVIGAELFSEDLYDYANSYISVERRSSWDLKMSTTQVYLSDFKPYGEVSAQIKNTGNANELVKLTFDIGGLIELRDEIEADSFMFVEVPAHRDTAIPFRIQRRGDLSYAERQSLSNSWSAHNLNIKASTEDAALYGSVRTTTLESKIYNRQPVLNSPLNAEVTFYNLLSQQKKKASTRVFGKILFPRDQMLSYSIGFYNFYFDGEMNRNLDLYQQLRYMIRYTDDRTMAWLGDRLGTGILHTLTGTGIRASHQLNDRNKVMLNVIQNPFGNNLGGFAGYGGHLGQVAWNTGVTLETTTDQLYNHYSFHLGANYLLRQRHSFNLQTATSLSRYNSTAYLDKDTTVVGVAYQFAYRYGGNRLRLYLENTNTMFTYLRNSGINRVNFTGNYKFEGNYQLRVRYYRSDYTSTHYPYNFVHPANKNMNDHGRLLFSYHRGRMVYQGGPRYSGTVRNIYVPAGDYRTRYVNYQPGLMGQVSFRFGNRRSLSPNASFNMMYYNYERIDSGEEQGTFSNRWTYNIGINYYDQAFKLSAYYTSGEAADVYRTIVINEEPVINQAIHFRPYYERYFLRETLRLSAYFNYSYYMPSMRDNMMFNLTGNIYVKRTWNFFSSFNVYRISRRDTEAGRMTSRDLNLIVGIRKSFDIDQPKMGHHDLTIVGFNDLDGDGIKGDNEKPISNVLVNISRDPYKNIEARSGFAETSMITDPMGEIYYENIPSGTYDLSIIPLSNLENLYFLNGDQQTIEINDDLVYFLPLVESYKIKGRIIIDRDPNSNEGVMSPEGIRVTAVSETGETYTALTSGFGTFVLDLPRASTYDVSIYNVFGENFLLERNSYKVQFTQNKIISLDFKFIERRRGIQYNEGEEYFRFNLGKDDQ